MKRMFDVAVGLDVHRDVVVATVRRLRVREDDEVSTRTFETFQDSLEEMAKWLEQQGAQVIGLESTGVYWQPVVRMLQRSLPHVLVWLVNPLHAKKVAGRKSDVSDSQWLSKLVMYGLVAPSFLASKELQELRKLTRHRTKLTADQTRYKNRVLKEMECSGIKLATVCSDALGKTARSLLEAMLSGQQLDADGVMKLAHGVLRKRVGTLLRALKGEISPSTVLVLRQLLRRLDDLTRDIADLEAEIQRLAAPMKADIDHLIEVPGVDEVAAAAILAETGTDMSLFPTAKNLTSWAGLCPGSEESAGKAKNAPTRKGNKYLRTILVQVAVAAKNTKGTFYRRKFRRLARLGPKKAAVALARSILTSIFYVLRDGVPYQEPETVPPPPHRVQAKIATLTAQLRALGFEVSLTPSAASPPLSAALVS